MEKVITRYCKLCESSGEDLNEDGLCPSCQRQEERIKNGTLVWWSGMLGGSQ